ncbi:MAG: alanine/glycine:cation symporter family protein [Candidatus Limivicinus sp.]|jgi:AGCS family alanine or glycine:cation symporter
METIIKINSSVYSFVWGPVMLALLVGTGIYLSVRTGFPQFRKFGCIMRNTLGRIFRKSEAGKGEVTPFQAAATALASTVGTGNIVGVTGAIILGGPGAVFWMWISALFAMCTKFAEITLAVKYRERDSAGEFCGGPMYYIKNGLGRRWKWLAVVFSLLCALSSFGVGNLAQINSISSSVNSMARAFVPSAAESEKIISLVTGFVVALLIAVIIMGGAKRIGQVAEKLVPFMAIVYIVCSVIVIFANAARIPSVLASIVLGAFNPRAFTGGAVGITVRAAMAKGVGRGVFSNEAGLGTAPIAHASTSEKDPVKQGMYGVFEVFMDTIVICTLTALVVLCSGAADGEYGNVAVAGVPTAVAGFASVFGTRFGSLVLAVGLLLFAGTTILGWALYGSRSIEFVFGRKAVLPYQIIFVLVIVLGSVSDLGLVWDIADTLNGLMSIPNLIAVLLLSPVAAKLINGYFAAHGKKE